MWRIGILFAKTEYLAYLCNHTLPKGDIILNSQSKMKTIFFALSMACLLSLSSCGNETDNKIEKLSELTEKANELTQKAAAGDHEASEELNKVANEIFLLSVDLKDSELNEEQKEAINEILKK